MPLLSLVCFMLVNVAAVVIFAASFADADAVVVIFVFDIVPRC